MQSQSGDFRPCQGSAQPWEQLPPHLAWSPIRTAYPLPGKAARVWVCVLSVLLSVCAGGLLTRAFNTGRSRPRGGLAVWVKEEAPVYAVRLEKPPAPEGGGSPAPRDPQEIVTRHFGNVLQLEASPAVRNLDPALFLGPGAIPTDSADGKASPGSGAGSGSGAGPGPGARRDPHLLSASRLDGVPLRLEDMAVDHRELPEFPRLAQASHLAGDVFVQVLVSEDGRPLKTDVEESVHAIFTEEVLRVMPLWRFRPVRVDGVKVRVRVRVHFRFMYVNVAAG